MVHFVEAYGLWKERLWGQWFGAMAGAVYIPFEIRHMIQRPSFTTAAVITFNLAVVVYLGWQFWRRRCYSSPHDGHPPTR